MKPRLSLKGRAVQILAQREHSRGELRRKLLVHANTAQPLAGMADADTTAATAAQTVDELLDWLQAHGYLSEARFVESRVNARASRFGNLRIRQELAQHGVALPADTAQQLKDTELFRARDVWRRKFGEVAQEAADRARQMRFLAGRGFSSEVIHRVVQGGEAD